LLALIPSSEVRHHEESPPPTASDGTVIALRRQVSEFAIGKDARAAVKAAVMCEDVARTAHISRQLGDPLPIAQSDIDRLYERYQNGYGRPGPSTP
jgi:L-ribulose-5-phosphate 4-epimerase